MAHLDMMRKQRNSKKSSNRTENDFAKKKTFCKHSKISSWLMLMVVLSKCFVNVSEEAEQKRKRIILRLISILQRVEGVHNCYFPIVCYYFRISRKLSLKLTCRSIKESSTLNKEIQSVGMGLSLHINICKKE